MNHWLVKSEPFKYSWEQFEKDGKTFWDGVRNYQARNNLRIMKKGDLVFWYHSNEGKEIVGIAKVAKEYYQDPTTDDKNWVVVDLVPFKKLKKTVTLEMNMNYIKAIQPETTVLAKATVLHNGSRTLVVEADIYDEAGTLYAKGRGTFFVVEKIDL